jgi:hypothetical protein
MCRHHIMGTIKLTITTILLLIISQFSYAQKVDWNKQIDYEQNRIDIYDGDLDSAVNIGSQQQNVLSFQVYISLIDELQNTILKLDPKQIDNNARALFETVKRIQRVDIPHITQYLKAFKLAQKLYQLNNQEKELELLKNDVKSSLIIADIINLKPYAKNYWTYAANFYPFEVLNKFKNLAFTPLGSEIITNLAKVDPASIKQYLGSNHLIERSLKSNRDSVIQLIIQLYQMYGVQSKSYALIDLIWHKKLTFQQAENITKNEALFYKTLIDLRKNKSILASYTVDKEIETIAMSRVVEINLRHDDSEPFRFAPINNDNAYEIYTSIVYSAEEVFTSSFLGMYKRLNEKRKEPSGYAFLEQLNFNKFRVFLKQCAGYNKIDDFLLTMNDSQQNALITMFVSGLYQYGGDLGPAVDVADTYGSLENEKVKAIFVKTIKRELRKCIQDQNEHGTKIYGLLYKLTGGNPNEYTSNYVFNIPALDRVYSSDLFKNDIHIQQHFFFDDEDGETAFNHWLGLYPVSLYKKEDKGNYVLISSISGKKMLIYANKPHSEIEGREDLKKLFEETGRFPDLIVHRGHSYYIENTLENMNHSNKVAILGSCGGYQNISKAMDNAMDVQIVSTKQVGTLVVNSTLIQEITENIRLGKDLVWLDIWKQIGVKLQNNAQFKDYIPPYKNLGAKFIKAYNEL